ncbi:hypothetical protein PGT21_005350 [Puccinia graminis f. sp. tritici]|uniref:Uncharacterized protein n=1 Tax=Puccinia graminis f. sp. tritici TaxID=56615 RepID=A0A5B0N9K8_PUCGR|nr:hypothetical protein PGT21_005350 [Puccinia graminis f. sp. tritici]
MPAWTVQNPSALISNVPVLDGNSVTFPEWRTRLEDLLVIQGVHDGGAGVRLSTPVHDIVTRKLSRPETDYKDAKPITQGSQRVYFAKESSTNWDSLSEVAWATMKMTLLVDLGIQYKDLKPASLLFKTICDAYEKNTRVSRMMLEDSFWCAWHNSIQPIAKWIAKIRKVASDLKSVKLTPVDPQIFDCLLCGLDNTCNPIQDHLVYSPNKTPLDNTIGALEAHEVSMQVMFNHSGNNYSAAAVAKPKKQLGCWNCGQTAKSAVVRAGATSAAPLGNGGPNNDEENEIFDKEIEVVWG